METTKQPTWPQVRDREELLRALSHLVKNSVVKRRLCEIVKAYFALNSVNSSVLEGCDPDCPDPFHDKHMFDCPICKLRGKGSDILSHILKCPMDQHVDPIDLQGIDHHRAKLNVLEDLLSMMKLIYPVNRLLSSEWAVLPVHAKPLLAVSIMEKRHTLMEGEGSQKLIYLNKHSSETREMKKFIAKKLTEMWSPSVIGRAIGDDSALKTFFSAPDGVYLEEEVLVLMSNYLSLESDVVVSVGPDKLMCNLCNVVCDQRLMFHHVLSESHFSPFWRSKQTRSILEEKLELFQKVATIFHHLKCLRKQFLRKKLPAMTDISSKILQMKHLLEGKPLSEDSLTMNSEEGQISTCMPNGKEETDFWVPFHENTKTSPRNSFQTLCSSSVKEEILLPSSVNIGNSDMDDLVQENLIFNVRGVNEPEWECGICGSVFEVFRGDLEHSLDLHIQNDRLHHPPTALPDRRCCQSVTNMSKTSINVVGSQIATLPTQREMTDDAKMFNNFQPNFLGNQCVCDTSITSETSSTSDLTNHSLLAEESIFSDVIFLERKHLLIKEKLYLCSLCHVAVKTKLDIFYHLLSPKHMSVKWMKNIILQELHHKKFLLFALSQDSSAKNALLKAVKRMDELIDKFKADFN